MKRATIVSLLAVAATSVFHGASASSSSSAAAAGATLAGRARALTTTPCQPSDAEHGKRIDAFLRWFDGDAEG